MRVAVLVGLLFMQGCVMMPKSQFNRERELWQSVGRLSGYLECQNQVINSVTKPVETRKPEEVQKPKIKEK